MTKQFLGADGQPKYFFSQEKADNFLEKKKATETHEVKPDGNRFVIVPKEQAND